MAYGIPKIPHVINASTVSAKNSQPFGAYNTKLLICCENELWYQLGDSTVVATLTSHHIPAGVPMNITRGDAEYLAVVLSAGSAPVYVSEIL